MILELCTQIIAELTSRGFDASGWSPHKTLVLNAEFLMSTEIVDLLDVLVTRREKVFRSAPVVGQESAKQNYDDAVLAIQAVKCVLNTLVPP
jgi:hypothetical protein